MGFVPKWVEQVAPPDSYRAIFKWGDPSFFKHPNERLYALLKKALNLMDEDFLQPVDLGFEKVEVNIPIKLSKNQLEKLKQIVGEENVKTDDFSRVKASYGKTAYDILRLRKKIIENLPDAVVYPRNERDVVELVKYCNEEKIPIYPRGGGSTVTRGTECVKGGICVDFTKHMNKIISVNEVNHTVTVEPGIYGPELEEKLNNAPKYFGTKHRYTCGHLPQSFEYSTVGGWVVTRGAGQNSTYYGKIEDLVVCQKYITPIGEIVTKPYPRAALGPSIDQIFIGSEGAYGLLVSVTLKIFRYMPENDQRFSFIFPSFEKALNACREIMQGQFGFPAVMRLSDPEETDVAMKLYGVEGTIIDKLIRMKGYKPMERCLLLGLAQGEKDFAKNIKRKIMKIAKDFGGMYTTGYVTKAWEKGRFTDPYIRDDLMDFGIVIDTLECAVAWDQVEYVWKTVRSFCKQRPNTIVMSHCSHFYPQGTNLYFIFVGKFKDIQEFVEYQSGIIDSIVKSGAALSHHHGIGKLFAPWFEECIGTNQLNVMKCLKKYFDPNNIMNPGGTLGLDLEVKK
ncbi:FAD-binding oxidoreductase [Pseudothermotoga thermarum]|uniref:Alkylglycerone-phosphate synthase n=1 Tax=Pseudothermotoga thermarum DSM 5069 TaxID=688269 RepID=F7YUG0_9THEM|nr:FAD-binding oxidoreductase [Pseudothermotoga thermarum]AEH51431.1 Alkylglycerone-phosphate synthase [Pseudothermotoga thermarum DSM 5069]